MTLMKRPLATAGATVLLALSLTACGGGAPTDASVKDFCKAATSGTGDDTFFKALQDEDYDKLADLIKNQVDELAEVGTPKDIPDDAREGFEIQLDAADGIDGDDVKKAFESEDGEDPFQADLSKDEIKKVEAFAKYQSETCTDTELPSGVPSDLPTDLPTDLPSDFQTDLPSDFPTELPSDFPTDLPTSPEDLESFLSNLPTQ